jgi:hypothetical protein
MLLGERETERSDNEVFAESSDPIQTQIPVTLLSIKACLTSRVTTTTHGRAGSSPEISLEPSTHTPAAHGGNY